MVGTRGAPAHYGGFETAVEEIGSRLAANGHRVRVYCRTGNSEITGTYRGMELVTLPALRQRTLETLSHTGLSAFHLLAHRTDAAFLFNAANAPFLPVLRAARVPFATHVDGLEWKRAKWGRNGKRYYRAAETASVWLSDALIADAQGIADYYRAEYDVPTELLTYGAPILTGVATDRLATLGLEPDRFHLVVARFEPENHVDLIVAGFVRSEATLPLVVVGSAPYADAYTARIRELAGDDPRVRLVGGVWDQDLLDQLYAHSLTYLHGHSVGGTNPSLLRAIGAGAATLAWDVSFNREVVGEHGRFFRRPADVASLVERAETDPEAEHLRGKNLQVRAGAYDWDAVADGYEDLARRLASRTTAGTHIGARRSRSLTRDWGRA
ncbi:DUF1972 domain-containing protein [Miniimonas sp. S16]|uniref:DUF1972 domain-containing protein n=1 Tax=Miniimonas sp. S16 TaxID=2171623 RepID=UPI000D52A2A0|nr:DUF1972 domain-containing protein [Miniimonas sp. S16]